eukprot:gene11207-7780_t
MMEEHRWFGTPLLPMSAPREPQLGRAARNGPHISSLFFSFYNVFALSPFIIIIIIIIIFSSTDGYTRGRRSFTHYHYRTQLSSHLLSIFACFMSACYVEVKFTYIFCKLLVAYTLWCVTIESDVRRSNE